MRYEIDYCFQADGWGLTFQANSIKECVTFLKGIKQYLLSYTVHKVEKTDVTDQVKDLLANDT